MSRIGKQPVAVPSGVTVTIEGQTVKVKGPKGELQSVLLDLVDVSQADGQVKVTPRQRNVWSASACLCASSSRDIAASRS